MYEIGALVFQNRRSEHAIPDWNLDEKAVLITKRALEEAGSYKVLSITEARRAEIDAAHQPATLFGSGTNFEQIAKELRLAKIQLPVDAFIVLGKHADDRGPWMPKAFVEGTGIYAGPRMQALPLPGETELRDMDGEYGNRVLVPFAFYRMSVIRASDLSPIASTIAAMPRRNRGFLDPPTSLPSERIHSSAYKEDFTKFTDDDKRVIRQAITNVLEASIQHTLRQLGFPVR